MLKLEEWMDIRALHREGHSIKTIAQMTGRSRNTVRKMLRGKRAPSGLRRKRMSKLDRFKDYVRQRYESCRLSAVRLCEEIRSMGYSGSALPYAVTCGRSIRSRGGPNDEPSASRPRPANRRRPTGPTAGAFQTQAPRWFRSTPS